MKLIEIVGEISIPRSFTFDELAAMPRQLAESSLLLGGRAIRAVRLADVTHALGFKSWARFAVVGARDGYAANIPIHLIADCLLVYAVGKSPLPAPLGGPVRMLTRGLGRCANVKDVATISLAVEPRPIEHACPHEHARTQLGSLAATGGQS